MPSYSTTNQNTRVFAPHVILSQDTSRLAIQIKTSDGLPLTGITAGDVIRYDVPTSGYTLSVASSDEKAEVMGVVESVASGSCTVVVSGSITYPSSRLTGLCGGLGGVDVLFLDSINPGGLTGTINLADGGEKIVKPVIQIAPHGTYNGIVVNYIGYKTGNQATVAEQSAILGAGAVMYGPSNISPGSNWTDASNELILSKNSYPDLYSLYASTADYVEKIKIQVLTGSPALSSSYPATGTQVWQVSGGTRINTGTVVGKDLTNGTVSVRKSVSTSLMDISKTLYINNNPYGIVSTQVDQFVVPAISTDQAPTQNGTSFVPYIKLYESTSVSIPDVLSIHSLFVGQTLSVGAITNLETKISDIDNKLSLLNTRLGGNVW
jgi:hypothetical protein